MEDVTSDVMVLFVPLLHGAVKFSLHVLHILNQNQSIHLLMTYLWKDLACAEEGFNIKKGKWFQEVIIIFILVR